MSKRMKVIEFNGVSVEITKSPTDGTIVVHVDTQGDQENERGPIVRVYLNDGCLFENPVYPIK